LILHLTGGAVTFYFTDLCFPLPIYQFRRSDIQWLSASSI
jgi:hypothetical protein